MLHEKIAAYRELRQDRKEAAQLDYDTAPDQPLDDLITDDKEILGNQSNLFYGRYRQKTDKIIDKIETAEGKKDTAGLREQYLGYRKNRTDIKIARLQEDLNSISGSFLSQHIDRQRRQKLKELQRAQNIRTGQIGKLERKRQNKPEMLQKEIDAIVKKKIEAMNRKAQHKILREQHGINSHNIAKRAEFLAKITPDQKRMILREAIKLVRKKNIERGLLDDPTYEVDDTADRRKIGGHYARTVE